METVLKFDRVVLTKELNDKMKKVGEVFEVANVLDDSFILRDSNTRVAIGVVSFEDFDHYFVPEENFVGWTPWQQFVGYDGQCDCMYRTNGRKVQVKFIIDNVRAESCCHRKDDFNLSFGIRLAYSRCLTKTMRKRLAEYQEKAHKLNEEILDIVAAEKKMISSLMS